MKALAKTIRNHPTMPAAGSSGATSPQPVTMATPISRWKIGMQANAAAMAATT